MVKISFSMFIHTRLFLIHFTFKHTLYAIQEKDKIVASFSIARIRFPTMLTKTFYLNKQEINNIETQIANYSPAYLIGKPEQICVQLTKKESNPTSRGFIHVPKK